MISLIAAMGSNRVIGFQGNMPWHLPADLKHFKSLTLHKIIVMGRKTYQSIGKPLPERTNIVVTHDKNFQAPGCTIINDMEEILKLSDDEIMIIGGSQLYQYFLPFASKLYLTYIHQEFTGDTFFPQWDHKAWEEVSRTDYCGDEKNPYDYSFVTLVKKAN